MPTTWPPKPCLTFLIKFPGAEICMPTFCVPRQSSVIPVLIRRRAVDPWQITLSIIPDTVLLNTSLSTRARNFSQIGPPKVNLYSFKVPLLSTNEVGEISCFVIRRLPRRILIRWRQISDQNHWWSDPMCHRCQSMSILSAHFLWLALVWQLTKRNHHTVD